jgi:hypothetical protein
VPVTAGGVDPVSVVRLALDGPGDAATSARVRLGRYRFRHGAGRTVTGWGKAVAARPAGSMATATVAVTPARLRRALPPTNFIRHGDRLVNGYHAIHVGRLMALADVGGPEYVRYARRWQRYRCGWARHPAYDRIRRADLACPPGPR